ncbi:MAG TPA: hypothetical protein VFZ53_03130, partial [Polyangiaceae bacterium]
MARSSVFALGVLLGAMAVALLDVVRAGLRMPLFPSAGVAGVAWLVSTGALVLAGAPLLLAHRAVWNALPRKLRALAGGFDGLVLGAAAFLVEDLPSIPLWAC